MRKLSLINNTEYTSVKSSFKEWSKRVYKLFNDNRIVEVTNMSRPPKYIVYINWTATHIIINRYPEESTRISLRHQISSHFHNCRTSPGVCNSLATNLSYDHEKEIKRDLSAKIEERVFHLHSGGVLRNVLIIRRRNQHDPFKIHQNT